MEKLIKKYLKKDDPDILHDLRVKARKKLSLLAVENKTDLSLEKLLKKSSKLRDTDVLIKICKKRKIKKFLQEKHNKLRKKFLEFLINFSNTSIPIQKQKENNSVNIEKCKKILNESFIEKNDKELHSIRLEVKKCRYTNPSYEKYLKKIQDYLGLAHDFYKCEKLMKKFGYNPLKIILKKYKYINKAEKARKKFLKILIEKH